ncbi:hypothetical protein SAMN05192554_1478 [Haloarchaeobius iranensis]|uniref:Uncharacterized protein n=1 Tax=Haloarchaeobius iranensis TaxID=996166 RepID=A0A1H0BTD6_9EURY|nr:hypothetical protein SAMN05192554_1478 [Haloarchaeobius iranensis]
MQVLAAPLWHLDVWCAGEDTDKFVIIQNENFEFYISEFCMFVLHRVTVPESIATKIN